MKIGIISDLHEDIIRTQEAIAILEEEKCEKIICLGDFVGYSAPYYGYFASRNGSAVISEIKKNCDIVVVGNHDLFGIRKMPQSGNFKYPKNWFELDYPSQKKIGEGKTIFEEENELSLLISKEEKEYIASLPEFVIKEIDGIKILFSHWIYPDFSGSEPGFIIEDLNYEKHFKFMKKNNCELSFIGHAHNKQRLFGENKIKYIKFNQTIKMENNTGFVVPCVAKTTFANGVTVFDTQTKDLKTIPLNSEIHIVPEWAKE